MRACLVGHNVDGHISIQNLGEHGGGVAHHANREGALLVFGGENASKSIVEIGRVFVEVSVFDAASQARLVDVDDEHGALIHSDGQWLRAAHATASTGQGEGSGKGSAKVLPSDRCERFEGALQNSLRADVDPRACRHLAVHGQPLGLQPTKLGPVRPVAHEVGVCNENAGRPFVRAKNPNGFA